MTYLRENNKLHLLGVFFVVIFWSCDNKLPKIAPTLITEKTPFDTDDPAIWVDKANPDQSIVFGTDKDQTNGGVYAFNLDGKIIPEKSITQLNYPNNVDVAYNFKLNDSTFTDILMFTEREKHQIRVYSIPEMLPLDNGGFPVFTDESSIENRRPMGIASYMDKLSNRTYAIVSRKTGPKTNYLYQYEILSDSLGSLTTKLVRKFGNFSGEKEIEAIAVDEELGYVYYADEGYCIRKYYANPDKLNEELDCFGSEYFKDDIEGIAIIKDKEGNGYLIVSNQQDHSFNIFERQTNAYLKTLNLGTTETDGCEVTTVALGSKFPNGLFVSMNDTREFYFHDLKSLGL